MDRLPEEIIKHILSYLALSWQGLAPYATITRRWQHAVEQTTFRSLNIFSLELELLATAYQTSEYRRQCLRELIFTPVGLIETHTNAPELVEDVDQQIVQVVARLFEILREPNGGSGGVEGVDRDKDDNINEAGFSLTVASPAVFRKKDVMWMNARPERLTTQMARYGTQGQGLRRRGFIPLGNLEIYRMSIVCATGLNFHTSSRVGYDPMAIIEMVRACPNLRRLTWTYGESVARGSNGDGEREALHATLVSSLCSLDIPHVDTAQFEAEDRDLYIVSADTVQDLSSPSLDVMATAWKTFSSFEKLKSLVLLGDFGPRSFRKLEWPNLQTCEITFRTFSNDGQRHFLHNTTCHWREQYDPDYQVNWDDERGSESGSDFGPNEDQLAAAYHHHNVPNPATVPATIVSLLVAIDRMPRLKQLIFQNTEIQRTCFSQDFTVFYYGVGTASSPAAGGHNDDVLSKRVYFDVGDWRPQDAGEQGEKIIQTLTELDMHHRFLDTFRVVE